MEDRDFFVSVAVFCLFYVAGKIMKYNELNYDKRNPTHSRNIFATEERVFVLRPRDTHKSAQASSHK